jgi:hypothetical protein
MGRAKDDVLAAAGADHCAQQLLDLVVGHFLALADIDEAKEWLGDTKRLAKGRDVRRAARHHADGVQLPAQALGVKDNLDEYVQPLDVAVVGVDPLHILKDLIAQTMSRILAARLAQGV